MKTLAILISVLLQTALFSGCAVHTDSYADSPEGDTWQLAELDGNQVKLPADIQQKPFIVFNPETGQATGYAGCNSFFGRYELDGSSLSFGPLGATQRLCSEPENVVEMEFLKALAETNTWEIRKGDLLFLKDDDVLCRFMPENLSAGGKDK